MKLIVGLGNPGRIYIDSRHNIGFSVIRVLAEIHKVALKRDSSVLSQTAKVKIGNHNVIVASPFTFMNLSGLAVSSLLKKYKIGLEGLLIVCDDLDLEFGRIKIRPRGSSAGQRGLESIIETLNSDNFSRLRIGIGRPQRKIASCDYVLSSFTKGEKKEIKDIIERIAECCRVWVLEGINKSMNIFNKRRGNE